MTIRDAIQSLIQVEADDLLLEKALIDAREEEAVDLEAIYEKSLSDLVDLAAIEALKALLNRPDFTEGGLTIKHDKASMKATLTMLEKRQDVWIDETEGATITDISNYW